MTDIRDLLQGWGKAECSSRYFPAYARVYCVVAESVFRIKDMPPFYRIIGCRPALSTESKVPIVLLDSNTSRIINRCLSARNREQGQWESWVELGFTEEGAQQVIDLVKEYPPSELYCSSLSSSSSALASKIPQLERRNRPWRKLDSSDIRLLEGIATSGLRSTGGATPLDDLPGNWFPIKASTLRVLPLVSVLMYRNLGMSPTYSYYMGTSYHPGGARMRLPRGHPQGTLPFYIGEAFPSGVIVQE